MKEKKESAKTSKLKEKLMMDKPRVWDMISDEDKMAVKQYAEKYKSFLSSSRTERKCVDYFLQIASKKGFVDISRATKKSRKVFFNSRGKLFAMAVIGSEPLTDGVRIVTSHIDSPRLDLKPNPLYEDLGLALLKTHYYGGIKKYQWVARSLAMIGTVVRQDGSVIEIEIGVKPDDPVVTIPDLLPHLSRKQMEQKASEFIPAENLNVIIAGEPFGDKDTTDRVKLAVLDLLNKQYEITEEDLVSAEIEIVPAEPVRDAGLDRSMVAGYGQDDRVCAYTSVTALLETQNPKYTAIAISYDKEEIGSEGNTSAKSFALESFLFDLMDVTGLEPSQRNLRKIFSTGKALSGDVTAAVDPTYSDMYEKRNNSKLGHGIGITKYTGSGGKYMGSDANAEYASWVRRLFNHNKVIWQTAGLGKVDEGGGGTVAKYLANAGIDIIDCGPPILGMHSPFEVCAKDDIWMCFKAYKTFLGSD